MDPHRPKGCGDVGIRFGQRAVVGDSRGLVKDSHGRLIFVGDLQDAAPRAVMLAETSDRQHPSRGQWQYLQASVDPRHRGFIRELRDDIAISIQNVDAPPRDDEPHVFAVPGDVRKGTMSRPVGMPVEWQFPQFTGAVHEEE